VTGGSGKLGRAVVDELLVHEHEVVNLDRVPSTDSRASFTRVDFTDFGQTAGALTAVDDRHDGLDAVFERLAHESNRRSWWWRRWPSLSRLVSR